MFWCVAPPTGLVAHSDLDERAIEALKEFNEDGALQVLVQFKESDLSHVQVGSLTLVCTSSTQSKWTLLYHPGATRISLYPIRTVHMSRSGVCVCVCVERSAYQQVG